MRERIREQLGDVAHARFLVFLMGPYSTVAPPAEARADVGTSRTDDEIGEMMALLRRVQGALRTEPAVNAYLAVDLNVPLDEMDAASQSMRCARESNVNAFVLPRLGDNFGVGMEVGAILEDLRPDTDRVVFAHESAVTSAMIDSVHQRWEARVVTYEAEVELVRKLRLFVADVMLKEATGRLPEL